MRRILLSEGQTFELVKGQWRKVKVEVIDNEYTGEGVGTGEVQSED